ncbi:MAG TPA: HEAT repeat domain-containing protein, partial [Longimicrobiales bacterium]
MRWTEMRWTHMPARVTTMAAVALFGLLATTVEALPQEARTRAREARIQEARYREARYREMTAPLALARSEVMRANVLATARLGSRSAERSAPEIPEPWIQQDPADSLYQAARQALNRGHYARSGDLFQQIRERYPRSGYVGDSYYFQALAVQRAGGSRAQERSLELLGVMLAQHPQATTRDEARALQMRIQGLLARQGNADAARQVAQQASAGCDDEDQSLRAAALSALLQMDSERAVPILREVLEDRDVCSAELRRRSIFILAQHLDEGAVDLLIDLAHRNPDPDAEVREQAVFWLSQVGGEEALAALESILQDADADEKLQEKAVFAVSQHSSPRAAEILRGYAERQGAPRAIRENAIFWLGQRGDAGASDYLRDLYGRLQDQELKERAIFSIAQTRSDANGRWLMDRVRDDGEDP